MIFVVVGTQKFALNRLLREMDKLIENGIVKDKVLAQTGYSDYRPKHYGFVDFVPKEQFDEMVKQSDLLITHSGVGTIVSGLKWKKPIIVYPRLAKWKEHVDDHQLEIAEVFSERNYVLVCREEDDLGQLIQESVSHQFDCYVSQRERMLCTIEDFLKER